MRGGVEERKRTGERSFWVFYTFVDHEQLCGLLFLESYHCFSSEASGAKYAQKYSSFIE